jgi:hypothetical protein
MTTAEAYSLDTALHDKDPNYKGMTNAAFLAFDTGFLTLGAVIRVEIYEPSGELRSSTEKTVTGLLTIEGFTYIALNGSYVAADDYEGVECSITATLLSEQKQYYSKGAFAHGIGATATGEAQAVFGMYNKVIPDALFIIGNGREAKRSNAFEIHSNDDNGVSMKLGNATITEADLSGIRSALDELHTYAQNLVGGN